MIPARLIGPAKIATIVAEYGANERSRYLQAPV
jgi:hypothetical protein